MASLYLHPIVLCGDQYPRTVGQCSNLSELSIRGYNDSNDAGNETQQVTDEMIANVFSPSRFPKLERMEITDFRANKRNMAFDCFKHRQFEVWIL